MPAIAAPARVGSLILRGTVDPSWDTGEEGDFYLNYVTHMFFGPKHDGEWGTGLSTIGTAGEDGDDGEDGADGLPGLGALDYGTLDAPIQVVGGGDKIEVSEDLAQRRFIRGNGDTPEDVGINAGNLNQLMIIVGSDTDNPFYLKDSDNVLLSGPWRAIRNSMLWLMWNGSDKWVEQSRNEI